MLVDRTGVTTIALVAVADGAVRPIRQLSGWVNEQPQQMSLSPGAGTAAPIQRTLWRVPTTGGTPSSTGLVMEGLRDTALHPNGRQIAFNAGWKKYESWVLEGVLAR